MNCPYCGETMNHGAVVCKTCRRDVTLVESLKEANNSLEQRVQELEAELAELREHGAPPVAELTARPARQLGVLDLLVVFLVLPTLMLVGLHYLLVIKFDARLVWLRAASIALPAVFGWVLERRLSPRWFVTAGLGVATGIASVFGMSTLVHLSDGDPILPDSGVALRETLEYMTSISLAYILGSLVRFATQPQHVAARRGRKGRTAQLATFIAMHLSGRNKGRPLEEKVQRVVKLINLAVSASTAIGAIYTGFKGVL